MRYINLALITIFVASIIVANSLAKPNDARPSHDGRDLVYFTAAYPQEGGEIIRARAQACIERHVRTFRQPRYDVIASLAAGNFSKNAVISTQRVKRNVTALAIESQLREVDAKFAVRFSHALDVEQFKGPEVADVLKGMREVEKKQGAIFECIARGAADQIRATGSADASPQPVVKSFHNFGDDKRS